MNVDFLIVGQGICGTFLSYYLLERGYNVTVIDQFCTDSASQIASGVINPVTGRRIVKTWMIDELMPFCWNAYSDIGKKLKHTFIQKVSVLDFHPTAQMQQAFDKRLEAENTDYLSIEEVNKWEKEFHFDFGIGAVHPAYWINLKELLLQWRSNLKANHQLIEEYFDSSMVEIIENKIHYKNIQAKKLIFCDGVGKANQRFFSDLPFAPNKGEAILVKIPELSPDYIYKKGLSIVPWSPEEEIFWVGSTYNWQFENANPTSEFRKKVVDNLNEWLNLPYEIIDHLASVRPANTERRPFVGWHEEFPSIGILNGMGTKGCSLAPFFAKELVDNFVSNIPINELADVRRFYNKKSM